MIESSLRERIILIKNPNNSSNGPFSQIEAAKQVLAKEEFKEVIAKLFGITEKSITTSGGNFPVNNQSLTTDC